MEENNTIYKSEWATPPNATEEQMAAFHGKHKELSILLDYPPFTISRTKRKEFQDGIISAEQEMTRTDKWDRPFSTLEVKWDDDLEEARLYQKRYGNPYDAQQAAMKLNNIVPDDWNEDIYPLYPSAK